jgi:hypothetical protein
MLNLMFETNSLIDFLILLDDVSLSIHKFMRIF